MPLRASQAFDPELRRASRPGSRRRTDIDPNALCWLLPTLDDSEERPLKMASGASRRDPLGTHPCELPAEALPVLGAGSVWETAASEREDAKTRYLKLASTLESDVIPKLLRAHSEADAPAAAGIDAAALERFVGLLQQGSDAQVQDTVRELVRDGVAVSAVFTQLLAPAARRLGELWEADRCDFSTITICLGQLQRVLREWSPAFGREVQHPPNGRRVLLAQHTQEQHSFGLSMVAEFFRRDGWEVLGGVGASVPDPSAQVGRDWFDALGFSAGSEGRIDWLKHHISQARSRSKNRSLVVLVGGPLCGLRPDLAELVGADALCQDGTTATTIVNSLLSPRSIKP
jgi:methanogenic corrinoid protein MtbC1